LAIEVLKMIEFQIETESKNEES